MIGKDVRTVESKLLSIVVPTKNRYVYLESLIRLIESFNNSDIELVIQDNSDDNSRIISFMKNLKVRNLVYNYFQGDITVVKNCDMAILNSSGKYVCFLGDDDLISYKVYDYVRFMDKNKIESSIFQVALYNWPGVVYKIHAFPSLIIRKSKSKIINIDVCDEFNKLLAKGATALGRMPKVYHGIIRRDKLQEIYNISGTFFPGPSPDIANSVALSKVIKKHVYCDVPIISSGTSPKSTAGLGAKHKHNGELKNISFLPKDIEERWNIEIPKIWTAATIYCQSTIEAMNVIGLKKRIDDINFNYLYAYFVSTNSNYIDLFKIFKKRAKYYKSSKFYYYIIRIFCLRVKTFIKNTLTTKFGLGAKMYNGVLDTAEAEKIIDGYIESLDLDKMYDI